MICCRLSLSSEEACADSREQIGSQRKKSEIERCGWRQVVGQEDEVTPSEIESEVVSRAL